MTNPSAANKGTILIVDDIPENLKVLSKTLKQEGYEVRAVTSGSMALRVVRNATPDIILLDIKMPEMDGYEVCRVLKSEPQTTHIPIIFLSALDEVVDKVTAFAVGGVDYITKPFQFQEVLARVNNQLQLQAAKAEVQRLNAELEKRVIQRTAQLEQEIVKRQRIQEELLYMALHDALTELPNRAWLMDRLKQVVKRSQQNPHYLFAILFLDCDRFKLVNDSLGHMIGDQLLIAISRRLESVLRLGDTISRFGGDEFVILLEEISQPDDAIRIAQDLQEQMKLSFHLDDYEIFIDISIGIVMGNQEDQQPDHLLRNADLALYKAKEKGKGRYQVFERKMHSIVLQNLQTETELRRAFFQSQFVVYYQPIIALSTRKIVGFEALVRWLHPQKGLVFPDHFLRIAEDTGLIIDLDRFVLKEACQQIKKWQVKFKRALMINVNFSTQLFSQPIVSEHVRGIIHNTQLSPSSLRIEITENTFIHNYEPAHLSSQRLKEQQIQISLDDFGTGFSSLSYLHQFPVDNLKIDRSFVTHLEQNIKNQEIVTSIINLAHNLEITVTAEGIETAQQFEYLRGLGCEYGQGYFFSPPVDAQTAQMLLKEEGLDEAGENPVSS